MQTVRLVQDDLEKLLAARPKHVFIAGASRGIGEAIARTLGEDPHNFTLAARSYNRLLGLAMDLGTTRAHAVKLDLANDASIDEAVVTAESKFGPIDVLILNAALDLPTTLADLSAENRARFRRVVAVNLTGTFFLAQLATAHMAKGGRVLFIGSAQSRLGGPGTTAYAASKFGAIGLMRTMALELADRGIRVNALSPGLVDTQMSTQRLRWVAETTGQTLDQVTKAEIAKLPVPRMSQASEVASYVKFLVANPSADGLTGQEIELA